MADRLYAERLTGIEVYSAAGDARQLLIVATTDARETMWKMTAAQLREMACWLFAAAKSAADGDDPPESN